MIAVTGLVFVVLLMLAVPVAFTIGMAGFVGLWWSGSYPLTVIVQQAFLSVNSFVLLAIPLFILAGALMETGGIAVRLVRFAQALVGWIRGGLAMAVVVAEYIFSGISGSTIADASAIGATMIPPMTRAGYKPEQAVSIVAAASAMGILVPPCILMIVIGAVANVSVAALFVAGFLPAVVLALAIMAYIYYDASRGGMAPPQPISWRELRESFVHALIPMGLPAIIFGGILGGIVTPTEAAAVAVLYAAIVGLLVYKEIKWSDLPRILIDSAVITASVCFLLGVAAVVAWMLAVAQVPAQLLAGMKAMSAGPIAFLILTALLFILLGAILEGLARGDHPAADVPSRGEAAQYRPGALLDCGGGGDRDRAVPAADRRRPVHHLRDRRHHHRQGNQANGALYRVPVPGAAAGDPVSADHAGAAAAVRAVATLLRRTCSTPADRARRSPFSLRVPSPSP